MKKAFAPVALAVLMMACNQNKTAQQQPENQPIPMEAEAPMGTDKAQAIAVDTKTLALDSDPVCGMPIHEVADTTSHEGKLYGFCSVECKDSFKKSPQQYLTANQSH